MAEYTTPIACNVNGNITAIKHNRYGYINSDQYPVVFFHRSQVEHLAWHSLLPNVDVIFDVYQNEKGWKAGNVCLVTKFHGKKGTVKWYCSGKGLGYISSEFGDIRITRRDVDGMILSPGDHVTFDLEKSSRLMRPKRIKKCSNTSDDDELDAMNLLRAEFQYGLLSLSPPRNTSGIAQNDISYQTIAPTNPAILNVPNVPSTYDAFKDVVGSVAFWNRQRNFGFLKCLHGKVFIHRSELSNGHTSLDRGDVVTFDIETSTRGYKAVNVRFIPDETTHDLYLSDESEYGATAAYHPIEDFFTGYASSSSSDIHVTTGHFLDNPARFGRRRSRRRSKVVTEVESGYESTRFVDDRIPQQLMCPICLGVFNDPVSAPCEHAFCKGCIHRWLREDDLCPVDRQTLDEEDLKPLPLLLRGILGQLRIRCSHSGCESIVNLDDIKDHENKCKFKNAVSQSSSSGNTRKPF